MLGMARRSRSNGTLPKRNVGPGCAFQEVGRIHQTRSERTRAIVAISLSRLFKERSYDGVKKKMSATAILPVMGARPKSQASRRLKGVLLIERHRYEPSKAMQFAAVR